MTQQDIWESAVRAQLKSENNYDQLVHENVEGLEIAPAYFSSQTPSVPLKKVNETCSLTCVYDDQISDAAYAFLLNEKVIPEEGKEYFIYSDHPLAKEYENTPVKLLNNHSNGLPNFYTSQSENYLSLNLSAWQNAGSSIRTQLKIALFQIHETLQKLISDDLKVICRLSIGENYFFEIAKLRSLRKLVAQMAKDSGVEIQLYIFAETSLKNKSLCDVENNLIRSTIELAAGMIGGADTVFSNPYTLEREPKNAVLETSFKQAVLLAYESLVNVYEDAGCGSGLLEHLTRQLCENTWSEFIGLAGEYLDFKTLYEDFLSETEAHALKELKWVSEKKIILTGVNRYPEKELKYSPEEILAKKSQGLQPHRWAEMYDC